MIYLLIISIAELMNNNTRYGRVFLSYVIVLYFLLITFENLFKERALEKKEEIFLVVVTLVSLLVSFQIYRTTGYVFFVIVFIYGFLTIIQIHSFTIVILGNICVMLLLLLNKSFLTDINNLIHLNSAFVFSSLILLLIVSVFFRILVNKQKINVLSKFYQNFQINNPKTKKPYVWLVISCFAFTFILFLILILNITNYGSLTDLINQKLINSLILLNVAWMIVLFAFSGFVLISNFKSILYFNKSIHFSILSGFIISILFILTQPGVSLRYLWIPSIFLFPIFINNFKVEKIKIILRIFVSLSLISLIILSILPSPINMHYDKELDPVINFIENNDAFFYNSTILTSFDIGAEIARKLGYLKIVPIDSYTEAFKKYENAFFQTNVTSVIDLINLNIDIVILSTKWFVEGIPGFISGYPPMNYSVYIKFEISIYSQKIFSNEIYSIYLLCDPADF
ncbi:MAG: hypothetical protein ACTSP3_00200 [Candidatus Heimdallarchaeaceae archaeon]